MKTGITSASSQRSSANTAAVYVFPKPVNQFTALTNGRSPASTNTCRKALLKMSVSVRAFCAITSSPYFHFLRRAPRGMLHRNVLVNLIDRFSRAAITRPRYLRRFLSSCSEDVNTPRTIASYLASYQRQLQPLYFCVSVFTLCATRSRLLPLASRATGLWQSPVAQSHRDNRRFHRLLSLGFRSVNNYLDTPAPISSERGSCGTIGAHVDIPGSTGKYWEAPGSTGKYWEAPGSTWINVRAQLPEPTNPPIHIA